MNFLPYLEIKHPETDTLIKLLIDSGANKNIISPGFLTQTKPINTSIRNVNGNQTIKNKGKLKIFKNLPPLSFYEYKFHEFFDGILGAESLARFKAKLNFRSETLRLNGEKVKFLKYFLSKAPIYHHTVTLDTLNNGDWFVPEFQKLNENSVIEPGLYKADNLKTTINIISTEKEPPKLPCLKVTINNYETIDPIPIESKEKLSIDEIRSVIRTEHLSPLEKSELINLIYNNQQVLLRKSEKLSSTTAIKHKIITNNDAPVYTKSYRYPHHYRKDVEDQIQEMLDNGIITHSSSPYSSPIWVVPKKTDASGKRKVRVVIDYRKLNDKTIDDKYPMPQIEDILDHLGKSVYFTTLDLKSGFHQIEMDPKHREKTAFSTDKGHFEFTRMPFGLKNAPATFQRAMNNILKDYIGTICYVYLDDIVIVGRNLKEHLQNLILILKRLSQFNLKIQLDKCEFLKKETEFLGHIISEDGVKPNPDKIEKILNWPIPKTDTQIKQFLGLAGYYRRFIRDFSKITKPMTKYLKKDIPLNLQDQNYLNAFNTLKQIISTDQVLAYPQYDKPFILTTDASDFALGAVLSQMQEGIERPIAFGSRTLSETESRYATNEKEALAIKWATQKFKNYLHGAKFTLVTDHKPLTFIKTSDKNPKILRWRLDLETFDYDIKYKEGRANVVADALSRRPLEVNKNEIIIDTNPSISGTNQERNSNMEEPSADNETIHSGDDSNDFYIHFVDRPINHFKNQLIFRTSGITTTIKETLFQNHRRTIVAQPNFSKEDITNFLKVHHNGKQTAILAPDPIMLIIQEVFKEHFDAKGHFVFTTKLVEDVQNEERQNQLIINEHERAHRGITEVNSQLKRSYYFPKMSKLINMLINSCRVCNKHKYERKPYNIKISPRPITEKPMERVHMDIFIMDSCNFLSLIDSFTKHLQLYNMKTKNLTDVQKALTKYFVSFGIPKLIVTDHETTFQSIQFRNFVNQAGSSLAYASSSEANGQIERAHSTIIEIFNSNKHKFDNLGTKSMIKLSVALYNNSVHSATSFTPNELLFNNNNNTNPIDIVEKANKLFTDARINMYKAQIKLRKQNGDKEDPPVFEENQTVYVIPNIRTKQEPRAKETKTHDVKHKTFRNERSIKRNKNKIKRIKKT